MGMLETSSSTAYLTSGSNGRHARTVTRPSCRRHVPTSSPFTRSAPGHTDLGHNSDRNRGCGTSNPRSADARNGSPAGSKRTVSTGAALSNRERSVRRPHRFRPSTSTSISSFSSERNVCCASESSPRVDEPKDPAHPPDHQANSLAVESPTDRGDHTLTNPGSFQADGETSLTRAWSAKTADRGALSWSPANAASASRPCGRRRCRYVARCRNASTFSRVIEERAIVDSKRTE